MHNNVKSEALAESQSHYHQLMAQQQDHQFDRMNSSTMSIQRPAQQQQFSPDKADGNNRGMKKTNTLPFQTPCPKQRGLAAGMGPPSFRHPQAQQPLPHSIPPPSTPSRTAMKDPPLPFVTPGATGGGGRGRPNMLMSQMGMGHGMGHAMGPPMTPMHPSFPPPHGMGPPPPHHPQSAHLPPPSPFLSSMYNPWNPYAAGLQQMSAMKMGYSNPYTGGPSANNGPSGGVGGGPRMNMMSIKEEIVENGGPQQQQLQQQHQQMPPIHHVEPAYLQCHKCGENVQMTKLTKHIREHICYTPLKCGECRNVFYTQRDIQLHMRTNISLGNHRPSARIIDDPDEEMEGQTMVLLAEMYHQNGVEPPPQTLAFWEAAKAKQTEEPEIPLIDLSDAEGGHLESDAEAPLAENNRNREGSAESNNIPTSHNDQTASSGSNGAIDQRQSNPKDCMDKITSRAEASLSKLQSMPLVNNNPSSNQPNANGSKGSSSAVTAIGKKRNYRSMSAALSGGGHQSAANTNNNGSANDSEMENHSVHPSKKSNVLPAVGSQASSVLLAGEKPGATMTQSGRVSRPPKGNTPPTSNSNSSSSSNMAQSGNNTNSLPSNNNSGSHHSVVGKLNENVCRECKALVPKAPPNRHKHIMEAHIKQFRYECNLGKCQYKERWGTSKKVLDHFKLNHHGLQINAVDRTHEISSEFIRWMERCFGVVEYKLSAAMLRPIERNAWKPAPPPSPKSSPSSVPHPSPASSSAAKLVTKQTSGMNKDKKQSVSSQLEARFGGNTSSRMVSSTSSSNGNVRGGGSKSNNEQDGAEVTNNSINASSSSKTQSSNNPSSKPSQPTNNSNPTGNNGKKPGSGRDNIPKGTPECRLCKETISPEGNNRPNHIMLKHIDKPMYGCKYCKFEAKELSEIVKHMKAKHTSKKPKDVTSFKEKYMDELVKLMMTCFNVNAVASSKPKQPNPSHKSTNHSSANK